MKELNYSKSGANEFKRKFAFRKLFLGLALLVAFATVTTVSAVETGNYKSLATLAVVPLFMVDGKFKELKGEDLTKFLADSSPEDLAAYYNAKNANDEAERKRLSEELKTEIKAENKAVIEAALKQLTEQIQADRIEQMKSLNETLKQHGLQIKKLSESEKSERANGETFETSLKRELAANKEKLTQLKGEDSVSAKNAQFSFTVKAVGTMLESTNISGGNVPVEQRMAGLNIIASRRIRLMELFSSGTASSNIISWVYQANKEGAAGGTAEGDTKNQIDFDLVVASQVVVKRTAFIKVSTEMLDDADFISSEIKNELMRELMKDIELTAYSGNNTAPNLNGIRTVATAFAAGTFAGTVDNANGVDVLTVAMNQIAIANQPQPTAILMHPSDVTAWKLIKVTSTDKRYVERLVVIAGNLSLDGVPIIPTTLVTAGTYLIGAFDMATLFTKGGIRIEMGIDGNDFTKNLRTIIAEWRGALVTKNNDRTAFVKGTFATDAAALETA